MSDPRRLLEDAVGFEREVLESASLDDPPRDRRARIMASIGTGTAAVAATSKGLAGLATWKIVVGLAGVGAIGVGVVNARADRKQDGPAAPTIAMAPRELPRVLLEIAVQPAMPAVAQSASAAVVPIVAAPTPPPAPTKSSGPPLTHEIALIDEARAAVDEGAGARALTALQRYDVECAGGALVVEASALRVAAVGLSGDTARAANLADAFLARHPTSAYAARVKKYASSK